MPAQRTLRKRLIIWLLLVLLTGLMIIGVLNLLPTFHADTLSQISRERPSPAQQVHQPETMTIKDDNHSDAMTEDRVTHPDTIPDLLPVLMYHHIDEQPERFVAGTITPLQFAQDMDLLQKSGYTTLDTADIASLLASQQSWPQRPLLITIDDGYASVYDHVFPVMKAREMKAIATVIGSSAGRDTHLFSAAQIVPHFTWDQAREMQQSGWIDIQSHSFDLHNAHPSNPAYNGAARQPDEPLEDYIARFTKDAENNRAYLEEQLPEHRVILYAYPYGRYNEWSEQILRDADYLVTLSVDNGVQRIDEGFYAMKRINRKRDWSSSDLLTELERLEEQARQREHQPTAAP